MFRLQNKLLLLLFIVFLSSCGFVDLRPIGLTIEPEKADSVLPGQYSPVILKFDTEMEKDDAEGIMQISSDMGSVRGDKFWNNNHLYFVPVQGWTAGVRYTLSLTGTIRSVDGRDMRIGRYVSFYAINKNTPPVLEWYSPTNGESTGTNNVVYEFHFSCSMDKPTVESALTLDGTGNKKYEWSSDDKILKIITDKALSPWTAYRWNLKDTAKSIYGVPLPESYSGYFITDLDRTLPQVLDVYPVLLTDGCWYPTGADIETGLRPGHGVAVLFNKPMGENALRSMRFDPSLTGRAEYLSEDSIVYIFTRDPEPDLIYTLTVSGDTRDTEGLKIGSDYRINFAADIPYLDILSIKINDLSVYDDFSFLNNVIPANINSATGQLFISIQFSLMFDFEEQQNMPQKINLTPFFPRSLAPVALHYLNWNSEDRLHLSWEGLKASDDIPNYYKLTIPGGKGGISPYSGIYMKEDFIIYIEVIK